MSHQSQKTKLHSIMLALSFLTLSCMSIARAQPWEQNHKLLASDGTEFDFFGTSVAVSGNLAVIGALNDDDNGFSSGSAYVLDVTTGNQLFKLLPFDGALGDNFGTSVALSENLAVIGALEDNDNGFGSGSAYVFDITTGQQLFKLLPSDVEARDNFGTSVAFSENLAVIGAAGDGDNGFNSGSAYVFDITTGNQLFKLLPSDGAADDRFGFSVALSGNTAVIGALGDDDNGPASGSAYVFDVTTGNQLFKLLPSDGATDDQLGISVAVSGNTAVIGARFDDDNGFNSGSAYVYDVTTGQQLFKLLPSDGAGGDSFGSSVALSGNTAVIGADFDDDNGSAYIFDVTTGQQLFKLLPSDGAEANFFGTSVALSGNLAVIGADYDDDNGSGSGSAYVFEPRLTNYLAVEPFPLLASQDGTFSLVQGLPDETSWLLYSTDGLGKTLINQLNVTVDIANPKIALGPGLTDANGDRQVRRRIPTVTEPMDIWFQAVQHNNVTNFFRTQIVP